MPPDPGWRVFPHNPRLESWLTHAAPFAKAAVEDPANAHWLRHGGTWFAGVDVLPNDAQGQLPGGPPLQCQALETEPKYPLHKAQVSVTYPGYPLQDPDESDAAHRFRLTRDAAHLDGLLPVGSNRRRMIREPHAFILGLPLTPMRNDNAPLTVWEGSHHILRDAIHDALTPYPQTQWPDIDLTDIYQTARRRCFDSCKRVEITARPGQAILLHRHILHGVAPWTGSTTDPRTVIYFRPMLPSIADWLTLP